MAFNFSTGNPNNITGATTASMNDIKNSFTDLATYLNGSIAGDSISSAAFPYRTVVLQRANIQSGDSPGAGVMIMQNYIIRSDPAVTNIIPSALFRFDPAHYAMTGKTFQVRLQVGCAFNGDGAGNSLPLGMMNVTQNNAGGTSFYSTINSTTLTTTVTGIANGTSIANTSPISAPSAGFYGFGFTSTPTITSPCSVTFVLQGRWV